MFRSALCAVALAGCYQPSGAAPCTVRCDQGAACPGSLVCGSDHLCNNAGGATCADVIGDARLDGADARPTNHSSADLVYWVNTGATKDVQVASSTGTSFLAPASWAPNLVIGSTDDLLCDVDGDGLSDLVAVNPTNIYVSLSNGVTFASPGAQWSSVAFPGTIHLCADVTGDGKADLIVRNNGGDSPPNSARVRVSNGVSFGADTEWANSIPLGTQANLMADVNADGKADVLFWDTSNVSALYSNGTSFAAPTGLWSAPDHGDRANLAADVNGDGKADLIEWSTTGVSVQLFGSTVYTTPTVWSSEAVGGGIANTTADVNGDGLSDLIAWDLGTVKVALSTGVAFSMFTTWLTATWDASGAHVPLVGAVDSISRSVATAASRPPRSSPRHPR